MEEKIKEIMAIIFGISQSDIDSSTNPDTVSTWDSLCHMKLVFSLEEEFDIKFSDDQIVNLTDVDNIMNCITELKQCH